MGSHVSTPRGGQDGTMKIKRGGALVHALVQGHFAQAVSKIAEEARKEVCVKVNDQEVWVLPLHIACAARDCPMSVIRLLIKAYPQALLRHSTSPKLPGPATDARTRAVSGDQSATSSLESQDEQTWGIGWLPIHVAAYYGSSADLFKILMDKSPSTTLFKTTQGHLPLHLASMAVTSSKHLIPLLLDAFPLGVYVPASDGVIAADLAEDESTGRKYNEVIRLLLPSTAATSSFASDRSIRAYHTIPNHSRPSMMKKVVTSEEIDRQVLRSPKLFAALSKRQWTLALEALSRNPRDAHCWTLSTVKNDPPCHLLPLHLAIRRNAPAKVIQALLNANSNAAQRREYYGMLPLHVACNTGSSVDVVKLLHNAYPAASKLRDVGGMLPLHVACSSLSRKPDVVNFLLSAYPQAMTFKDGKKFLARDYLTSNDAVVEKAFDRGMDFWSANLIAHNHLALLICKRQWDKASERLKQCPAEAKVWSIHPVVHLRYLPIHYVCIVRAPLKLVKELIAVAPNTAFSPCEEHDMLPLHLACQHGAAPRVIIALIKACKLATKVADSFGLLPLHLACIQGANSVVVNELVDANPNAVKAIDGNGNIPEVYAETVVHPQSEKVMQALGVYSL